MAKQKGRSFLVKLGASGAGGTLAAVTTNSVKINNAVVDVTNKDSGGWRELLEGAGTQSLSLSVNGKASDAATYETFKGYAQAQSINVYQIIGQDGDAIECSFEISGFEEAGDHDKELTFTATLESSGTPTFTNA